jgi:hypothetical protein
VDNTSELAKKCHRNVTCSRHDIAET